MRGHGKDAWESKRHLLTWEIAGVVYRSVEPSVISLELPGPIFKSCHGRVAANKLSSPDREQCLPSAQTNSTLTLVYVNLKWLCEISLDKARGDLTGGSIRVDTSRLTR